MASSLSLTACTADSTSLAEMQDATVQVVASNGHWSPDPAERAPVLDLVISSATCPKLRDDAVASLDGRTVEVVGRGGRYDDIIGSGCDQISLRLVQQGPRPPGTTSTLTISDPTATWTIAVPNLEATDLVVAADKAAGRIVVTNRLASTLSTAYLVLSANHTAVAAWSIASDGYTEGTAPIRLDANRVVADLPGTLAGDLLQVSTTRDVVASRCEGPATCHVSIEDSAAIPFVP